MADGHRTLRLGPDDVGRLRELSHVFAEAFEDSETYLDSPPTDAYLADLLGRPEFIAIVAIHCDAIVGGLVAYELPKFEQARSEIYIYDLAVAATHRRRGIATALVAHVRSIAAQRGAWVVYVQADIGDEPAIALYSGLGRREDVLHFDIEPAE